MRSGTPFFSSRQNGESMWHNAMNVSFEISILIVPLRGLILVIGSAIVSLAGISNSR